MNQAGPNPSATFTRLAVVAFPLVLVLSVFAALQANGQPYHLASAAVVFFFSGGAWALSAKSPSLYSRSGETCYILGYIATIGGLGALAYRVSQQPSLLEPAGIKDVLSKASVALLSTLIGLVAMNVLKAKAAQPQDNEEQMIERLLREVARVLEQQGARSNEALANLFQTADLAKRMQEMATSVENGSASMAALQEASGKANENLSTLSGHMKTLNDSVCAFRDATREAGAQWVQVNTQLGDAAKMGESVTKTGTAVDGLEKSVSKLSGQLSAYEQTLAGVQTTSQALLGELQNRLNTLLPVPGAIHELVTAANAVAPTLREVGQNFSDLSHVNQNVRALVANVQDLNHGLQAGNHALETMGSRSQELDSGLGAVLQALAQVTPPLRQFGDVATDLKPGLDGLSGNVKQLSEFSASVAELQTAVAELSAGFSKVNTEMGDVQKVIEGFVKTMARVITNNSAPPGPIHVRR